MEETQIQAGLPVLRISKNTEFEKLMARLNKEKAESITSQANIDRRRNIIKEIASAYFFLRIQGLGYSPLAIEEFEATQEYLIELAKKKTKSLRGLYSFRWRYFLKNKFFRIRFSPINGSIRWYDSHPWESINFSYSTFRPDDIISMVVAKLTSARMWAIPPNLEELVNSIYNKRCGPASNLLEGENGGR